MLQLFAKWGRRLDNGRNRRMALQELAEETGVSYVALKKAAQQDRLEADKSGKIWLSTPAAVERAVKAKKLRPK